MRQHCYACEQGVNMLEVVFIIIGVTLLGVGVITVVGEQSSSRINSIRPGSALTTTTLPGG